MTASGTDPSPDNERPELRLAVISTPRSGNTWTRLLLESLYGLESIGAHFPDWIDWANLPRRSVIQIHWDPEPGFVRLLESHRVRVVCVARHPLDILMSWLNQVYYKHQDGRCKGDGGCTECGPDGIVGVFPRSERFMARVTGPGGRVFLSQTAAWWDRPGVLRTRYESLLENPHAEVSRLVDQIGEAPLRPIAEAVAERSFKEMNSTSEVWRFHCWQGQAGLWRKLLTVPEARAIYANVPEAFEVLGYPCDPDEALTPLQADYNWARLQLDSLRDQLSRNRESRAIRDADAALDEERRAHESTRAALAEALSLIAEKVPQASAPQSPRNPLVSTARRVWTRFTGTAGAPRHDSSAA